MPRPSKRRLSKRLMKLFRGKPTPRGPVATAIPIRDAGDRRLHRLEGRLSAIEGEQPLRAPGSDAPCLFYWLRIYIDVAPRHPQRRQRRYVDELRICPRLGLDDGTASALVLSGDKPPLPARNLAGLLPAPEPIYRELRRYLHSQMPRFGVVMQRRYSLLTLDEGANIALVGLARREPDPDPRSAADYRGHRTRVVLVPPWFGALRVEASQGEGRPLR